MSKELSRATPGKTLYILVEAAMRDFANIQRLLDVLNRLVEAGNRVIIIENIMGVINSEDWIIDLGPEGGEKGE